jgi:hypothetical protein
MKTIAELNEQEKKYDIQLDFILEIYEEFTKTTETVKEARENPLFVQIEKMYKKISKKREKIIDKTCELLEKNRTK